MIAVLLNRLLTSENHEGVARHRRRLEWLAKMSQDLGTSETLTALLAYDKKFGRTPNFDSLAEFVQTDRDFGQTSSVVGDALHELKTEELDTEFAPIQDIDVLIDYAVESERREFHTRIAEQYRKVVNGAASDKDQKTGINEALAKVRKQWLYDLPEASPVVAGALHEQAELLKKRFDDYLLGDCHGKIPLGFPTIDSNYVAQKGKFLAIAGYSGDGKTTFLNTAVYNMARHGFNVLHVTLEFSPEEMFENFAFLHSSFFREQFAATPLPPQNEWYNMRRKVAADAFTAEEFGKWKRHVKNMRVVVDDLVSRTSVPGLLDVQCMRTWDEIIGHLEANQERNHYDVLVVDYFGELNVDAKPGFEDQAINAVIQRAIDLSRSFDEGRGILVISPAQVTKAAKKEADNRDNATDNPYDLPALSSYPALRLAADMVIGVYSNPEMKNDVSDPETGLMQVCSVKARKPSLDFPMFHAYVNKPSGYVRETRFARFQPVILPSGAEGEAFQEGFDEL